MTVDRRPTRCKSPWWSKKPRSPVRNQPSVNASAVWQIVVAGKHARPARQDLTGVLLVPNALRRRLSIDAQLDARDGMAGRIETEVARAANGEERRRFGKAIAGCNQPAQSLELPTHFGLERRTSRDDDAKVRGYPSSQRRHEKAA